MIRQIVLPLAAGLVAASPAAARTAAPSRPGVAVISAGSDQALAIGKVVIARPFGAVLVDRLVVAGSSRARGGTFHLIRGEAGGDCPVRYLVVFAPAGGAPAASEPFGTCAGAARGGVDRAGYVVTMPATAAGGPPVRFRYENGRMRLLDARPALAIAGGDGRPGFAARQASTCRTPTSADPATQASVIAEFDRSYPAEYRSAGRVRRADISPDELRATVTGLACLSRWPGAERVVPDAALPLFASKRYGPAAFQLVETIARDPSSDVNLRAAVRAFGSEMTYRVERRQPL